jgi:hypothetical protein
MKRFNSQVADSDEDDEYHDFEKAYEEWEALYDTPIIAESTVPQDVVVDSIEINPQKKTGFFSNLFTRKAKPVEEPITIQSSETRIGGKRKIKKQNKTKKCKNKPGKNKPGKNKK